MKGYNSGTAKCKRYLGKGHDVSMPSSKPTPLPPLPQPSPFLDIIGKCVCVLSVYVCVCVCVCALSHFSHVQRFAMLWTVPRQAPLSMRFSKQKYWCGLPYPPPADLPSPGVEPVSLISPALTGRFLTPAPPGKPL